MQKSHSLSSINADLFAAQTIPLGHDRKPEDAMKQGSHSRLDIFHLRKAIEDMRLQHAKTVAHINSDLEVAREGKDHAEARYQKLLGQVNTIKKQLGERLKADADELERARDEINQLQADNQKLVEMHRSAELSLTEASLISRQLDVDVGRLRDDATLSKQNWATEKGDFLLREAQWQEDLEVSKQAQRDWEVLAHNERSSREDLEERIIELEERALKQDQALDVAVSERDVQSMTVNGLQKALDGIQEARKQELREVVESSQTQMEKLRTRLLAAEESAGTANKTLEHFQDELTRLGPYEKEVREKNLLIGKLRHEAVILNEHLTKALRFLKRGSSEDNIDRHLITNHFIHFLALDRADPKKFQVLQLISALLAWTDEENEAAGLARPGGTAKPTDSYQQLSLRIPIPQSRPSISSSNSATINKVPSPSAADRISPPTAVTL